MCFGSRSKQHASKPLSFSWQVEKPESGNVSDGPGSDTTDPRWVDVRRFYGSCRILCAANWHSPSPSLCPLIPAKVGRWKPGLLSFNPCRDAGAAPPSCYLCPDILWSQSKSTRGQTASEAGRDSSSPRLLRHIPSGRLPGFSLMGGERLTPVFTRLWILQLLKGLNLISRRVVLLLYGVRRSRLSHCLVTWRPHPGSPTCDTQNNSIFHFTDPVASSHCHRCPVSVSACLQHALNSLFTSIHLHVGEVDVSFEMQIPPPLFYSGQMWTMLISNHEGRVEKRGERERKKEHRRISWT